MEQNQALQLLVAAVQKAQANGVYTLEEAAALAQAVDTFRPPEKPQTEEVPAAEEE